MPIAGGLAARGARRALVSVAVVFWPACAQPLLEPTFVPIAGPGAQQQASAPDTLEDYPTALAAIVDVLESELKLPRPEVTLVLFANRRSFEAGLLSIGYPRELARDASAFGAIGGARAILANAGILDTLPWPDRVRLLAHELTHSVQYVLAGGERGRSDQWLREGVADWVAFQTTAALGYMSYGESRRHLLERLASAPPGLTPAPLDELATFPQWVAAQRTYHDVPLYTQAFLGAELLIQQYGFEKVSEYFARFASSDDRQSNFRATFARDLSDFERAFEKRWYEELISRQPLR
ncbi:MAG: hypothetical protein GEV06_19135 [Luteitalea sp.]|nr:hypothetical protein [Luteitalea sp.]